MSAPHTADARNAGLRPVPLSGLAATLSRMLDGTPVPGEIRWPSGDTTQFGSGAPHFRVTFHSAEVLKRGFDEFAFAQAYVNGEIDIDGDMMSLLDLRAHLNDRTRLVSFLGLWSRLLFQPRLRGNKQAIASHYSLGDDFYLCFMDSTYRLYSHGLFQADDEPLERAAERKLETMAKALQLRAGQRLLDIGAGWGGVAQYCGSRGVHVTELTIGDDSFAYIQRLIRSRDLSAEVLKEDFLAHRPMQPYDAVAILGVIEHIPYYRRFAAQVWKCLKPGGLLYLDASASREKYDMSEFTRHYIWPGTHTFMCLPDVIQELLYHGFELLEVRSERHDYTLSIGHWASRFDANRERIVQQWGEGVYRAWRVYLWGACHAFKNDVLQAYHLVARRGPDPGPRPSRMRRVYHFARGMA